MDTSLTITAFERYVLTSDILYPSNCILKQVDDQGSIQKSLEDIDIFDRQEVQHSIVAKGFRVVARAVCMLAIITIAGPTGMVYHSLLVVKHSFFWLKDDRNFSSENWMKVANHAHAFMLDFSILFLTAGCALYAGLGALVLTEPTISLSDRLWIGLPLEIFGLLPVIPAVDPRKLPLNLASIKPIMLRHDFGIVNRQGGLLQSGIEDDEFMQLNQGYFGKMYFRQGLKFLTGISDLVMELPEGCKLPFSFPPKAKPIIEFLKKEKPQGVDIAAWEVKLTILQKNVDQISAMLEKYLNIKERTDEHNRITMPNFPFYMEFCREYFNKSEQALRPGSWVSILQKAKQDFVVGRKEPKELSQYFVYRKRIQENKSARELLGLSANYSKADVRRAYFKAAQDTHPDRLGAINAAETKEAQAIFNCLRTAYNSL